VAPGRSTSTATAVQRGGWGGQPHDASTARSSALNARGLGLVRRLPLNPLLEAPL
jgi:hypothetical protein